MLLIGPAWFPWREACQWRGRNASAAVQVGDGTVAVDHGAAVDSSVVALAAGHGYGAAGLEGADRPRWFCWDKCVFLDAVVFLLCQLCTTHLLCLPTLHSPILFRAFAAANAAVRLNALNLLLEAFPLMVRCGCCWCPDVSRFAVFSHFCIVLHEPPSSIHSQARTPTHAYACAHADNECMCTCRTPGCALPTVFCRWCILVLLPGAAPHLSSCAACCAAAQARPGLRPLARQ